MLEDSSGALEEGEDRGVEEEAALTDLDLDTRKFVWQRSIELLISIAQSFYCNCPSVFVGYNS